MEQRATSLAIVAEQSMINRSNEKCNTCRGAAASLVFDRGGTIGESMVAVEIQARPTAAVFADGAFRGPVTLLGGEKPEIAGQAHTVSIGEGSVAGECKGCELGPIQYGPHSLGQAIRVDYALARGGTCKAGRFGCIATPCAVSGVTVTNQGRSTYYVAVPTAFNLWGGAINHVLVGGGPGSQATVYVPGFTIKCGAVHELEVYGAGFQIGVDTPPPVVGKIYLGCKKCEGSVAAPK
jgi:hypothetical protein